MSYLKGCDCFHREPDTVTGMACRVCTERLLVLRNQIGPTSFIGAIASSKTPHDLFYCQYSELDWHKQLLALKGLILKTPSRRIQLILEDEANEILATRIPTITRKSEGSDGLD